MHHPQIYDIISIIEDYFLLTDITFRCQIEPFIYTKTFGEVSEDNQPKECQGLKIIRQLNNGRIEVNIFGYFDDNDSMDFHYFHNDHASPKKVIEIINQYKNSYRTESAKAAIREIMILDRESAKVSLG